MDDLRMDSPKITWMIWGTPKDSENIHTRLCGVNVMGIG